MKKPPHLRWFCIKSIVDSGAARTFRDADLHELDVGILADDRVGGCRLSIHADVAIGEVDHELIRDLAHGSTGHGDSDLRLLRLHFATHGHDLDVDIDFVGHQRDSSPVSVNTSVPSCS